MHTLVQAASRALAAQDADALERLVEEARAGSVRPFSQNLRELAGALDVLAKQVRTAETHLGMNERKPWER